MGYRVDTVPKWIRPIYVLLTEFLGAALYALYWICHQTCSIEILGEENLKGRENFIYCLWHQGWWSYFAVFLRHPKKHVWMNHPKAYMRVIHVCIRRVGVERIILGSEGEEGRKAADLLANVVQNGASTVVSPDGPHGPPKVLRKGVLHIALKSGVPIVPMNFFPERVLRIPSWDSKAMPVPFSKITVVYRSPIYVTQANFEASVSALTRELDRTDRPSPTL